MTTRGMAFEKLSKYFDPNIMIKVYDLIFGIPTYDEIVSIENKIINYGYDSSGKSVIFLMSQKGPVKSTRYIVLAHGFAKHGFKPVFVVEDGTIPITSFDNVSGGSESMRMVQSYKCKKLVSEFGDIRRISDYVVDDQGNLTLGESDLNLDAFARASTRKLLYHIESNYEKKIKNQFERSGYILSDAYESLYAQLYPACIISNENKYNM